MVGVKVKPLPKKPVQSPDEVASMLSQAQEAIITTLELRQATMHYSAVYNTVFKLVNAKHGAQLYDSISILKPRVSEALRQIFALPEGHFTIALEKQWKDHMMAKVNLASLFAQLDGYINEHKLVKVDEMVLIGYREFLQIPENQKRVRSYLLELVDKTRQGEWTDSESVSQLCRMLVDIGINSKEIYQTVFESAFLQTSRLFYQREAMDTVALSTWSEYLKYAEKRRKQEQYRVEISLDASTALPLMRVLRDCFVTPFYAQLTEASSGVRKMLEEGNTEDLKRAYNLLKEEMDAFQELKICIFSYIVDSVETTLGDHDLSILLKVQRLFALNNRLKLLLSTAFASDRRVEEIVSQAFDKVFSAHSALGQTLAAYVDLMMTKEIKQMADVEIDALLDNFMSVFRFLRSRDVFEAVNKSLFAKRLLLQTSLNNEAEKGLLRRLKMECGPAYTRKVEGMITDIEAARSEPISVTEENIQIEVLVLKSVYWPSDSLEAALMPVELGPLVIAVNEEYSRKFPQRLLDWKTNCGSADMVGRFGDRSYEFLVSTYQMLVLMYFNSVEKVVYEELITTLGVKFDKEFYKHVFGLIHGKLVLKSTHTKVLEPGCELWIAPKFESKLRKIKISIIAPKRRDKPIIPETTPSDVLETRKLLTDMAIVRVMKARRVLEPPLLVAEVIRQLSSKFPPEPKDIKARTESLIEREYLRQSEDGRIEYVA